MAVCVCDQFGFITDEADKMDCSKCKCIFQCTDDIIAALNTPIKEAESTSPNIKHFRTEFDVDAVNIDAQSSDEIMTTSSFKSVLAM